MRRALAAAAAVVASLAITPATAVTSYNSSPAPERTEVGALVVSWDDDADPATPNKVDWYCTGTMVDASTFLTAAHCTSDWPEGTEFYVSLHENVSAALASAVGTPQQVAEAVGVRGTAHNHPDYPGPDSDLHDIAVVEVPAAEVAARWSFTPAALPTENLMGTLGPQGLNDTPFTIIGYGVHEADRGPGGHTHSGGGVRLKAPITFNALTKASLQMGTTEPQGNGGQCYGDSGGPYYATIDGTRVLVGTATAGAPPCYGGALGYRVDTPGVRTFLASFVALP